jgi:hypothetical protein
VLHRHAATTASNRMRGKLSASVGRCSAAPDLNRSSLTPNGRSGGVSGFLGTCRLPGSHRDQPLHLRLGNHRRRSLAVEFSRQPGWPDMNHRGVFLDLNGTLVELPKRNTSVNSRSFLAWYRRLPDSPPSASSASWSPSRAASRKGHSRPQSSTSGLLSSPPLPLTRCPRRRPLSVVIITSNHARARRAEHDSSECEDLTLPERVHSLAVKGHNG